MRKPVIHIYMKIGQDRTDRPVSILCSSPAESVVAIACPIASMAFCADAVALEACVALPIAVVLASGLSGTTLNKDDTVVESSAQAFIVAFVCAAESVLLAPPAAVRLSPRLDANWSALSFALFGSWDGDFVIAASTLLSDRTS